VNSRNALSMMTAP